MNKARSRRDEAMSATHFVEAGKELELCPNPIFIIGSPRSGTTALAKSLEEHSGLWYAGYESWFVNKIFSVDLKNLAGDGDHWLEVTGTTKNDVLAALALGINMLFTRCSGGKRWIDKTPRNTLIAPTLAASFPGAVFIHALRDARDVVPSMLNFGNTVSEKTRAAWAAGAPVPPWVKGFREACRHWQLFVNAALSLESEQPARCLTVRYERLVERPNDGFREILAFLGMPFERAPVDRFQSVRFRSSFPGRPARHTSDPWSGWTAEERRIFVDEAGETMARCGFISDEELASMADQVTSGPRQLEASD
jgi:hypothetical protein